MGQGKTWGGTHQVLCVLQLLYGPAAAVVVVVVAAADQSHRPVLLLQLQQAALQCEVLGGVALLQVMFQDLSCQQHPTHSSNRCMAS